MSAIPLPGTRVDNEVTRSTVTGPGNGASE
jgi:hypothetical protein